MPVVSQGCNLCKEQISIAERPALDWLKEKLSDPKYEQEPSVPQYTFPMLAKDLTTEMERGATSRLVMGC